MFFVSPRLQKSRWGTETGPWVADYHSIWAHLSPSGHPAGPTYPKENSCRRHRDLIQVFPAPSPLLPPWFTFYAASGLSCAGSGSLISLFSSHFYPWIIKQAFFYRSLQITQPNRGEKEQEKSRTIWYQILLLSNQRVSLWFRWDFVIHIGREILPESPQHHR